MFSKEKNKHVNHNPVLFPTWVPSTNYKSFFIMGLLAKLSVSNCKEQISQKKLT